MGTNGRINSPRELLAFGATVLAYILIAAGITLVLKWLAGF